MVQKDTDKGWKATGFDKAILACPLIDTADRDAVAIADATQLAAYSRAARLVAGVYRYSKVLKHPVVMLDQALGGESIGLGNVQASR